MRTFVYIDGYNLYYGRLQGTPWKWLDVSTLAGLILKAQNPLAEVIGIRFFTAGVIARLATHGTLSVEAQGAYHRALRQRGVDVVFGKHQLEQGFALHHEPGEPPDRSKRIRIWRLSEKETDLRLALSVYRDAAHGNMDQAVLVTSDTDMVPLLEALRTDFPAMRIGVIQPRRPGSARPPSGALANLADWSREHIRDEELAASQLPDRVPGKRKPALKPAYW